MYSDKVMDHFQHPRNVGEIEDASGVSIRYMVETKRLADRVDAVELNKTSPAQAVNDR